MKRWEQYEELAAAHLSEITGQRCERTGGGADSGIDVRGDGYAAQVKAQTTEVGRPAVQQLVGAAGAWNTAVFYSLGGYRQTAVDFADSAGVALFEITVRGWVEPVNRHAQELIDQGAEDPEERAERERLLKNNIAKFNRLTKAVLGHAKSVGHERGAHTARSKPRHFTALVPPKRHDLDSLVKFADSYGTEAHADRARALQRDFPYERDRW